MSKTKPNKIIIYCDKQGPRLNYILDFIFNTFFRNEYDLISDSSIKHHISFCPEQVNQESIHIKPNQLLFESNIDKKNLDIFDQKSISNCLQNGFSLSQNFDVFSLTFLLISRYEEYLDTDRDQWNRFPSTSSLLYSWGMLRRPIVDQLLMQLKKACIQNFNIDLVLKQNKFQFTPSIDVDHVFHIYDKPLWKKLGKFIKTIFSFNPVLISNTFSALSHHQKDAYFNFEYLNNLHQSHDLTYFILMGDYDKYDTGIGSNTKRQKLFHALQNCIVGIHPSLKSNTDSSLLQEEISNLERLSNEKINRSRQHYLALQFPDTFQRLIKQNITKDYSLLFADNIGFRAGTSRTYDWFDLSQNKQTQLQIHPVQVMDVTLKNYLQLDPKNALKEVVQIIKAVKNVRGKFGLLWHNSSFLQPEWDGWQKCYEEIVAEASKDVH